MFFPIQIKNEEIKWKKPKYNDEKVWILVHDPTCQCREQTGISVSAAEKNVENLSHSEGLFGWLSADWLIGLSEDKVTDSFSFDICSDESFSEPVKRKNYSNVLSGLLSFCHDYSMCSVLRNSIKITLTLNLILCCILHERETHLILNLCCTPQVILS